MIVSYSPGRFAGAVDPYSENGLLAENELGKERGECVFLCGLSLALLPVVV